MNWVSVLTLSASEHLVLMLQACSDVCHTPRTPSETRALVNTEVTLLTLDNDKLSLFSGRKELIKMRQLCILHIGTKQESSIMTTQ